MRGGIKYLLGRFSGPLVLLFLLTLPAPFPLLLWSRFVVRPCLGAFVALFIGVQGLALGLGRIASLEATAGGGETGPGRTRHGGARQWVDGGGRS